MNATGKINMGKFHYWLSIALATVLLIMTATVAAQESVRSTITSANVAELVVIDTPPGLSENPYRSVAVTQNGRLLAAGSTGAIDVWDLSTGEKSFSITTFGDEADVLSLAFSPDGKRLASASWDFGQTDTNTVYIWDMEAAGTEVMQLPYTNQVNVVTYHPDGNLIATAGVGTRDDPDNTVRLWDAASGEAISVLDALESRIGAAAFGPSGQLAAGSSNMVVLWDSEGGQTDTLEYERPLPENGRPMSGGWSGLGEYGGGAFLLSFTVSEDGTTITGGSLFDGSSISAWSGNWTITSNRFSGSIPGQRSIPVEGEFPSQVEATGTLLYTGTWAAIPDTPLVKALDYSPDGSRLASATDDGAVQIWDESGELVMLLANSGVVTSVAYNADGSVLAVLYESGHLRLWDAATGELLFEQQEQTRGNSLAFSADGSLLVTAGRSSEGGIVILWGIPE